MAAAPGCAARESRAWEWFAASSAPVGWVLPSSDDLGLPRTRVGDNSKTTRAVLRLQLLHVYRERVQRADHCDDLGGGQHDRTHVIGEKQVEFGALRHFVQRRIRKQRTQPQVAARVEVEQSELGDKPLRTFAAVTQHRTGLSVSGTVAEAGDEIALLDQPEAPLSVPVRRTAMGGGPQRNPLDVAREVA